MKNFYVKSFAATLLLLPAVAFAAYPGQWTGPYIGVRAGLNSSSFDGANTKSAFTAGIYGGYDIQLSQRIVLGGDLFYDWNQDTGHDYCRSGVCGNLNFGSKVYGVEGRIGFPLGMSGNFMPYAKIGYSHLDASGDVSGSDNGWRIGGGVDWRLNTNTSVIFQYTHGKYGSDADDWKNNNFSVGVSFRF